MRINILSWLRRGPKALRIVNFIGIAYLLYWLIHFVSTSFKVGQAFAAMGIYVLYIVWLKHQRVANLRLAGMDEIDQMDGTEFQQRMLLHFQDLGWRAKSTKGSGNFGADLILTRPDGLKIVAQCKRYADPVGIDAVQEVVAAIRYYSADMAMMVTSSHLTKAARELARVNDVEVWERDELAQSLSELVDERSSVWEELKFRLGNTFRRRFR
ncbi:restriction endonuclease [Alicyclobacillus mengziensis]|uniref:Restriction endonuclease n=1 Tax=Alicyclobacillus mengziensis TaxID=2931921 RepID=A0A9X7VYT8_9BACL|nr:restriction endonuclease [Alicyclobacillus mengziensis]QSO47070.1 restriction endonuclease [Alicyclobacillus mengziensis]